MLCHSPRSSTLGVLAPVLNAFSNQGWDVIFFPVGRWLGSKTSNVMRNSFNGLRNRGLRKRGVERREVRKRGLRGCFDVLMSVVLTGCISMG